ncbi:MAG TPA: MarR family transcriptional regulator [Gemmatimonadaceae bacterium]|nr:MarR family transcriptional regulator [Gemmatimonadaceae bacterium]
MPTRYRGAPREVRALDTYIKLARAQNALAAALYRPLALEEGVTESQLGVLEALLHLGPLSQSELSRKLLTSGSNLTTVLDNLERHGLVRRQRRSEDRRVQVVHLSDEGRRLIKRIFPAHVERLTRGMGVLTVREQETLGRLCRKLGRGQLP